jgi:alkanesulfonate monooxygenase SsuD/methylene tetrahydromethanopterin reductase-like flavin-dependent oxidoreductase (luciferase family)
LSEGRVILGVGLGNYKEELAATYPDRVGKNRRAMLEEGLELLRKLFTEHGVTFEGKYFKTQNLDLDPKPFQNPLPILIGGHHINGLDRAVRYGQGWIPGWMPFDEMKEWIAQLLEKTVAAGRDPKSMIIAPHFTCAIARKQEEAEALYMQSKVTLHRISMGYSSDKLSKSMKYNLIGTPENILKKVEYLGEIGVNHLSAISFSVDSVSQFSEQVHFFAEEVMLPYRLNHQIPEPSTI